MKFPCKLHLKPLGKGYAVANNEDEYKRLKSMKYVEDEVDENDITEDEPVAEVLSVADRDSEIVSLREQLDLKRIPYDKRFGVAKLRELLA